MNSVCLAISLLYPCSKSRKHTYNSMHFLYVIEIHNTMFVIEVCLISSSFTGRNSSYFGTSSQTESIHMKFILRSKYYFINLKVIHALKR